ncbi:MAG TPA: hypothetical protein VEW48_29160 [Thermoanaerobaculia bacterium]|nr:hypothetical protein [Thermoanaerobaculia bacterium]
METDNDIQRQFLRHTVATLAYRGGKALRGAPDGFGSFRLQEGSRTPLEILSHIGDLFDWAVSLFQGQHVWRPAELGTWEGQVERFFSVLRRFDEALASPEPLGFPAEKLFQGPIADAFTHVGQIAMLRRLAGAPVRGENYFKADIEAGRVGPEQTAPRVELD